ncbi:MAG: tRNA (adenosine(37)-N6)-threonylcarbamoyltransferase complex dimerization subunit type 1 TsaB [Thermomicrobiales bacterium]
MMERVSGLVLALDTSSDIIGYAIADGDRLLAEAMWRGQRQGTAMMLAAVMRALEALELTQDDLGAVAVAIGPGSFSGLRVGMGIAKGLALGLGIPIVGIPTLAVTAEPFRSSGRPICTMIPAGRGRFAYAVFTEQAGTFRAVAPATHGTAPEIGTALAGYPAVIVCGEFDDATATVIAAASPGAIIPPAGVRERRPGALAAMAMRRILAGETDDLVALEPIYLHTSPAPSATRATKG